MIRLNVFVKVKPEEREEIIATANALRQRLGRKITTRRGLHQLRLLRPHHRPRPFPHLRNLGRRQRPRRPQTDSPLPPTRRQAAPPRRNARRTLRQITLQSKAAI